MIQNDSNDSTSSFVSFGAWGLIICNLNATFP